MAGQFTFMLLPQVAGTACREEREGGRRRRGEEEEEEGGGVGTAVPNVGRKTFYYSRLQYISVCMGKSRNVITDNIVAESNTAIIVDQQPRPHLPPSLPSLDLNKDHPAYRGSQRLSKRLSWHGDGSELASRAYAKARRALRASTSWLRTSRQSISHRRKVSEPIDFRRISISPVPRLPSFRPIQLSIYIPGNELPKLPIFNEDPEDARDLNLMSDISRPPQAVMRSTSDPLLTRSPSNFSIPRKPVASRQSSMDGTIRSIGSDLTLTDAVWRPRTSSLCYSRSRRPSVATNATSRSNKEFLDMLNAPLPALPSLQTAKPPTSSSENASSVVRRASEQSKRLQTHLQERGQVDARSPDCSTIAEEKSPISPMSPTASSPAAQEVELSSTPASQPISAAEFQGLAIVPDAPPINGILKTSHFTQSHDRVPGNSTSATTVSIPAFAPIWRVPSSDEGAAPRSSSGSSTLLNLTTSATPDIICTDPSQPAVVTTITHAHRFDEEKPSVGRRLSQWLFGTSKALSKETMPSTPDLPTQGEQERSDSAMSDRSWFNCLERRDSKCVNNEDGERSGLKHEGKGLRKRGETVSPLVTHRSLSLDIEKFPVPEVREVGVAI